MSNGIVIFTGMFGLAMSWWPIGNYFAVWSHHGKEKMCQTCIEQNLS